MSDQTKAETTKVATGKPSAGGITAVTGAVTQPVAKAGRGLFDQVAGNVQWYLERWEDVVYEARADRAGVETLPDVNSILGSLAQAKAVSECPGRVRLSVRPVKGQDQLAYDTVEALAKLPGIRHVEASPLTATILITYKTRTYPALGTRCGRSLA